MTSLNEIIKDMIDASVMKLHGASEKEVHEFIEDKIKYYDWWF